MRSSFCNAAEKTAPCAGVAMWRREASAFFREHFVWVEILGDGVLDRVLIICVSIGIELYIPGVTRLESSLFSLFFHSSLYPLAY